ncbi:hypothetical protein RFI_03694, partial [Reticulomyxa filosa]
MLVLVIAVVDIIIFAIVILILATTLGKNITYLHNLLNFPSVIKSAKQIKDKINEDARNHYNGNNTFFDTSDKKTNDDNELSTKIENKQKDNENKIKTELTKELSTQRNKMEKEQIQYEKALKNLRSKYETELRGYYNAIIQLTEKNTISSISVNYLKKEKESKLKNKELTSNVTLASIQTDVKKRLRKQAEEEDAEIGPNNNLSYNE